MATKTSTLDLQTAYAEATSIVTTLRLAYVESAARDRDVRAAIKATAEQERRALVEGREHKPDGSLTRAQEALGAAHVRVDELRATESERMAAFAEVAKHLDPVDAAEQLRKLMADGEDTLALAVDQVAATRENLERLVQIAAWLRDESDRPARLTGGIGALATAEMLPNRAGEGYSWHHVDAAQRAFHAYAARLLEKALAPRPQAPPNLTEWDMEMLTWHIAAGGSSGDSVGDIRARYLERGPRRVEAARVIASAEQASGHTWIAS